MYSLAWLVVVGVVGAILGAWLGHVVAKVRSGHAARVQELEAQLGAAHDELAEYKSEVFEQFSKTARKFKALDETYHDLHRQLAESAGTLCGEGAGPLLAGPDSRAALNPQEAPEESAPSADEVVVGGTVAAAAANTTADAASDLLQAEDSLSSEEAPILVNEAAERVAAAEAPGDAAAGDALVEGDLVVDLEEADLELDPEDLSELPLAQRLERQQRAKEEAEVSATNSAGG